MLILKTQQPQTANRQLILTISSSFSFVLADWVIESSKSSFPTSFVTAATSIFLANFTVAHLVHIHCAQHHNSSSFLYFLTKMWDFWWFAAVPASFYFLGFLSPALLIYMMDMIHNSLLHFHKFPLY